ncbi:MAG: NAD(P)-dependent glycerol-3-phosphate dehydrogenase [Burkholderiales bacterium]|nr:NAD(P)-dependent glycerol-3-phosphate dehydrogenase [Burkholderiales bacterium]
MKIAIIGAGAWGTAIAMAAAARQHEVLLWARDAAQAAAMQRERRNARYLPEVALPPALHVSADERAALAHGQGGLTILATPMAALRERLAAVAGDGRPVLWLSKGFESGTGALGHEVAREVAGQVANAVPFASPFACGVISGPSFALEVARGQPTALVAASADAALAAAAVQALHGETLRVYSSSDIVGVEVGGAVKNVLAIAVGALDGMQLGLNARAALITRGLAEMTRLGVALGAQPATFMGLSGLGDLVLTATGDLSRNRRVGMQLAAGCTLAETLAALGHVAEGVPSAPMVLARAQRLGVEMPITACVADLLEGRLTVREALARLMSRDARSE